ncbi:hypothetical protein EDC01DRAFT_629327 [Geopyxis carbonaria]|nr:hypothetical protein EDC01DRAFT_629327 [Geopyxis carbonaria]
MFNEFYPADNADWLNTAMPENPLPPVQEQYGDESQFTPYAGEESQFTPYAIEDEFDEEIPLPVPGRAVLAVEPAPEKYTNPGPAREFSPVEQWPVRLTYAFDGEDTATRELRIFPPIHGLQVLYNLVSEATGNPDHSKKPWDFKLQYRMKHWPVRDPCIDLVHWSDGKRLDETVRSYLSVRRSNTPWFISLLVIYPKLKAKRAASEELVESVTQRSTSRRKINASSSNSVTTSKIPKKSLAAQENDRIQDELLDQCAAQITEANLCALHTQNKSGCWVKQSGDHLPIPPGALRYWAACLKDKLPLYVTEKVPPVCHWFENSPKKSTKLPKTPPHTPVQSAIVPVNQPSSSHAAGNAATGIMDHQYLAPTGFPNIPPHLHALYNAPPMQCNPYSSFANPWASISPLHYPIPHNFQAPVSNSAVYSSAAPSITTPVGAISPSTTQRRKELVQLPLRQFLQKLDQIDPRHSIIDMFDNFDQEGITPDLIPSMSDSELDEILGKGRKGIRLYLRKHVGKDS